MNRREFDKTVPMWKIVAAYSNAVGRYGPDSDQAREIRKSNADNSMFMDYADALDAIKRHLGGSGMEKTTHDDQ